MEANHEPTAAARQYVHVEEAADTLGVSPRTLRRLAGDGQIPRARKVGRRWLIPVAWVDGGGATAGEVAA